MELVFCSNNIHKLNELKLLINSKIKLLSLQDIHFLNEILEPFDTLEKNATNKSNQVFNFCNKNCIADDTGLFIDSLNGEPGVYSARYAGSPCNDKNNIEKVLLKMKNKKNRNAYFKTVISLKTIKGEWLFSGICNGIISEKIVGINGFGYDAIFIPKSYNKTFAELDAVTKNKISHRYKAILQLIKFIEKNEV